MRVLRRDDGNDTESDDTTQNNEEINQQQSNYVEPFWWLCEHTTTRKTGFVPRNYLGLFPIWKHRKRHNFVHFELNSSQYINRHRLDFQSQQQHSQLQIHNQKQLSGGTQELSTYA